MLIVINILIINTLLVYLSLANYIYVRHLQRYICVNKI